MRTHPTHRHVRHATPCPCTESRRRNGAEGKPGEGDEEALAAGFKALSLSRSPSMVSLGPLLMCPLTCLALLLLRGGFLCGRAELHRPQQGTAHQGWCMSQVP